MVNPVCCKKRSGLWFCVKFPTFRSPCQSLCGSSEAVIGFKRPVDQESRPSYSPTQKIRTHSRNSVRRILIKIVKCSSHSIPSNLPLKHLHPLRILATAPGLTLIDWVFGGWRGRRGRGDGVWGLCSPLKEGGHKKQPDNTSISMCSGE